MARADSTSDSRSGVRVSRNCFTRCLAAEALESRMLLAVGDFLRSLDNPSTALQPLAEAGTAVAVDAELIAVGAPWDDSAGKSDVGQVHLYERATGSLLRTIQSQIPTSGGRFGHAIDISGNRLVAATPFADAGAIDAGIVELFDASDGTPLLTISNPSPARLDYFGQSVAIEGDRVVVGAFLDDTFEPDAGIAYVFDATSGVLLHALSQPNPSLSDYFGFSVAISGDTVAVGARRADGEATDDGAVYLFDAATGTLIHEIANPTPENFDSFGRSVALSGDLVVIGADGDNTGAPGAGAAYVYAVSSGELIHTLSNPTPAFVDLFGYSVGISGDNVVVGAQRADEGAPDSGAAYLFAAATGELVTTWASPTPADQDVFGAAIAVDGSTAVVGAYWDDTAGTDAGAAYVFDVGAEGLLHALPNPTLGSFNYFGYSVAVEGTLVAVGAPFEDVNNVTDAGQVFLFDAADGDLLWTISNPQPAASDSFGLSVAVSGNLVAVGAYRADSGATDSGIAYVFDAATGDLVSTLENPTPANQDYFGFDVAIWNDQVIVGAYRDDAGAVDAGSAYLFDATTGLLLASISNPTPDTFDYFGYSVAISDVALVVGAYQDDTGANNAGSVYVFDRFSAESVGQIHNPAPAAADQFGLSVAVWGTTLAVGAPRKDLGEFDAGAVYLFHAFTGSLNHTLVDAVPQVGGNFGGAIAMSHNLLAVGARRRDFPRVNGAGSVDLFDATTGLLLRQVINPTPAANDFFGWSVATGSNIMAVGTPLVDGATTDRGAVSLFYSQDNAPPFAAAGGPYVGVEGAAVEFSASGSFDDRDPLAELSIEWDFDYEGSSFDVQATGLTTTATFEDDFPLRQMAVRVTDSLGLATIATTTLGIANVAPTLVADQSSVTVVEAGIANNTGSFADPGDDTVELTASAGTIVDNGNGTWNWSFATVDGPDDTQVITITATDSDGDQASVLFDLQVDNQPPDLLPQEATIYILAGAAATNSGTYGDSGNDNVSLSSSIGTIVDHGNGTWDWVLTTVTVSDSQTVMITATDSDAATSSVSFELVVTKVIADSASITVDEGATAQQSGRYVSAAGGTLDLSASIGVIVSNEDETWSWTYDAGDGPGDSQTVAISAQYDGADIYTAEFALVVDNIAPTVTADQATSAALEGTEAANTGSYLDPGGDTISLEASIGRVVDNGDNTWSWSFATGDGPDDTQTVTISATDSDGGVGSVMFDLEVANEPPRLSIDNEAVSVLEGTVAGNAGTFGDPGDDVVSLASSVGVIVDQGNGMWDWSFPTASVDDSQRVTITATDADGATVETSFQLVVTKVVADSLSVTVAEGSLAEHHGRYRDPGAGTLELSASAGLIADNGDGTWSWSYDTVDGPEDSQMVTISADYNSMEIFTAEFALVVNNVAPTVIADQSSITVVAGDVATNTGTYLDPGDDTLSLTASVGVIVDNGDGTWHWSWATVATTESQTVVIRATDSDTAVASESFDLVVVSRVRADSPSVTVDEAAAAENSGSYVNPGAGTIVLTASIGAVVDNGDGSWSWSYDSVDGPDNSQTVTIFAEYGGTDIYSSEFALVVNNVPPAVTVDQAEVTVVDGGTATNTGLFSDVGDDDVSLAASVGVIVAAVDGTWTWSFTTIDGVDDSQTVTIVATDSDGASSEVTFELMDNDRDAGPAVLDLNNDGSVDVMDTDAIIGEVLAGRNDPSFDLSGDGLVDNADLTQWLFEAATHNGFGDAYLAGDTDLDGSVDPADLNALALSWRKSATGWSLGDFTADGFVDSADLNALALNWRHSIPAAAPANASAPEPPPLLATLRRARGR